MARIWFLGALVVIFLQPLKASDLQPDVASDILCAHMLSHLIKINSVVSKAHTLKNANRFEEAAVTLADLIFDPTTQRLISKLQIPDKIKPDVDSSFGGLAQAIYTLDELGPMRRKTPFFEAELLNRSSSSMEFAAAHEALGDLYHLYIDSDSAWAQDFGLHPEVSDQFKKAIIEYEAALEHLNDVQDSENDREHLLGRIKVVESKKFGTESTEEFINELLRLHRRHFQFNEAEYELQAISKMSGLSKKLLPFLSESNVVSIDQNGDLHDIYEIASMGVLSLIENRKISEALELMGALTSSSIYLPADLLKKYKHYWNIAWEKDHSIVVDLLQVLAPSIRNEPTSWGEFYLNAYIQAWVGEIPKAIASLDRAKISLQATAKNTPSTRERAAEFEKKLTHFQNSLKAGIREEK
ncbi:MAG: hypothetical protein JWQ35_2032 [Bacteriovoracaceae bacterium]|nr:hypothetical protein [Bacteriovoracaceae bacterium]